MSQLIQDNNHDNSSNNNHLCNNILLKFLFHILATNGWHFHSLFPLFLKSWIANEAMTLSELNVSWRLSCTCHNNNTCSHAQYPLDCMWEIILWFTSTCFVKENNKNTTTKLITKSSSIQKNTLICFTFLLWLSSVHFVLCRVIFLLFFSLFPNKPQKEFQKHACVCLREGGEGGKLNRRSASSVTTTSRERPSSSYRWGTTSGTPPTSISKKFVSLRPTWKIQKILLERDCR